MRRLYHISIILIVAMPVCLLLVRWPVAFGLVGGGLCCLALVMMAVQIATSGERHQAPDRRASATVDGVPVKSVEVLP